MSASKVAALACAAVLALPLAACGGSATVSSTDAPKAPATVSASEATTASTSPATSTASSTATAASSAATSTATTTVTSSPTSSVPAASQPGPVDKPASAIESLPAQASHFTAEERSFLDQLSENGLNVAGVEDQLTATGLNVCANDTITRDAVAGQLVEQRRTDMTPDALGQLISDAARANLC